jgi:hypothetical protein
VFLCTSFGIAFRVGIERALSSISASVILEGACDGCAMEGLLGPAGWESLRVDEDSRRFEDHGAIAELAITAEHSLQIVQDGGKDH